MGIPGVRADTASEPEEAIAASAASTQDARATRARAAAVTSASRSGTQAAAPSVSGNWYSSVSPWNTPIPVNPPIAPASGSMIAAMNQQWCPVASVSGGVQFTRCIGPGFVSTPSAWIAQPTTPLVTVQVNYPRCDTRRVSIPIPAAAEPSSFDNDPEPVMTVMEASTGVEWDLFKVTRPGVTPKSSSGGATCSATSNWAATAVYRKSPGWTGLGTGGGSTRASGTWLGSGMIRKRDAQMPPGSTWSHALALAYPGTLRGTHVWPATGTDGRCTDPNGCIPMGARIQLDPSVDCASWPSLDGEWQRQLCRTLQRYGMIVVDTGAGLITEQLASVRPYVFPWERTGWKNLPADITPYLRVIDWTKWGAVPPPLLDQLRAHWKIGAQKLGARLVVTVNNTALPENRRVAFRVCATAPGGKRSCKSTSLRGPDGRAAVAFRVSSPMTKSRRLEIFSGGGLQASRTVPALR
jgi:hypothetical protein